MLVYMNPKSIGTANFESLKSEFPTVQFITEDTMADQAEVCVIMPNYFVDYSIETFHQLKWVQLLMAGYDNFDFSPFKDRGILVSNAVDIFSISLAEDVFTKIFVINRNVKYYLDSMKIESWDPIRKEPELTNSTVGIIGAGSIGKEAAKRLKAFDCKVLGYKRTKTKVEYFDEILTGEAGLESMLKRSDYVIVAVPLTDETRNLLNKERLGWMKSTAVLINVARGPVIDQEALVEVLQEKRIRAAGLDVTTPEPLPKGHPLWKMENVFITPHNASSSPFMQKRLKELVVHNLRKYLEGKEPDYIVYR